MQHFSQYCGAEKHEIMTNFTVGKVVIRKQRENNINMTEFGMCPTHVSLNVQPAWHADRQAGNQAGRQAGRQAALYY